MLSQRLPPMTIEEALETTKVYSVDGLMRTAQSLIATRPFRAPHHTVSEIGMAGGGAVPIPVSGDGFGRLLGVGHSANPLPNQKVKNP